MESPRSQTMPFRACVCFVTGQLHTHSFARRHHVGILLTLWQSEPKTQGEHLQERFLGVVQTLQKDGFALICLIVVVFLDFILLGGNEIA